METTTIANQSRIQTKSAPDSKSSKSSLNQLKDLSGSSAGGFKTLRYSVTTCTYRDISDDLFALRKLVYHDETGLLAIGNLIDENDQKGEHVVIRDNVSGKIIATSMTIPAEESDFAIYSGLKPSQLTSWFLGSRAMVHPEWRSKGLYKLIVYLVARHARINGRKGYIAFIEEGEGKHARKVMATQTLSFAKIRKVKDAAGLSYDVIPVLCEADHSCAKVFETLTPDLKELLSNEVFGRDLRAEIEQGIGQFYAGKFCKKVTSGTISKSEYITAMANNHQFVRWTTRLLARISCETANRDLRNHFLSHLSGEVDHDLWIENDLTELGADVAYVRDFMIPNTYIGQFMGVQESAAAFARDPVQFLAVPIAIEAITAFMPKAFISGLHRAIGSWGIKNPAKASSFLTSHIYTDGGVDGHWVSTFEELKRFIKTERQHQMALHTVKMVLDAVTRAYESYVEDSPIDADPSFITH